MRRAWVYRGRVQYQETSVTPPTRTYAFGLRLRTWTALTFHTGTSECCHLTLTGSTVIRTGSGVRDRW